MAKSQREIDEERHGWKRDVPAIYADTFEVSVSPSSQIARIVFGEYAGREAASFHRVAVAMPIEDAKAFIRTLGRLIREIEKENPQDTEDVR